MAQLFQPTNITPDTRGAFGNGIVIVDTASASDYIEVSWQVNGNTPMTAFKIDFTDMGGTLLYSTGKLTYGCPFYGVGQDGNPILFQYLITQTVPSNSFLRAADEGLMRITQWWGNASDSESISQLSPSQYIVRPPLIASITSTPATSRIIQFYGSMTGAESDGLMWSRWVLKQNDNILSDTGRIYGSAELSFTYDSFLPGEYTIELTGETSSGVLSSGGTMDFTVSYSLSDTGLPITASRDCNGESAVSVKWPRLQSVPVSSISPDVTDNGRTINLPTSNSYLEWNTVNGASMALDAPWSIVWCGNITTLSGVLFEIQTSTWKYTAMVGTIGGIGYVAMSMTRPGYPPHFPSFPIEWNEGPFMCIITPTTVYWRCLSDKGSSLYPQEYLYPLSTLYPGGLDGTETMGLQRDISDFPVQSTITSVTLHGPSSVKYFEIFDYGLLTIEVNEYLSGSKSGSYGTNTWFYIGAKGAEQTYNAGNYPDALQNGTTIQIYRESGNSSALEYAGKTAVGGGNQILDYAARSQQGPYKYYMYVLSSEKYINVPSISNEVNPCFWDWVVLSCTEKSDGSFVVQSSYRFGKNLVSGSVTNNNQPGVFKNFTPYPTVMIAPQNYQSGTLQSLIGVINNGEYSDTINLRDAIYELSTTKNTLFLKNRKGDLLKIRPTDSITMETMDNTRAQAQTVSFPWAEVGDASDAVIYSAGDST